MKINFIPKININPQPTQIRRRNFFDTVSLGNTEGIVKVSDYINLYKVGEVKLYDKFAQEQVLADITDSGDRFGLYKNDVLLGEVEYAVEDADIIDPMPADFIDSLVLFNPNPYSQKVLRGHLLKALKTDRYKGIGTTLVKALVQKSLELGTDGNVVVYALNDFPEIKAKKEVSPIPFYHMVLGFEPMSFETKKALDIYLAKLEKNPKRRFDYIGRQEDWMYLPSYKIKEYKEEFEQNPIYDVKT